MTLEDLMRKLPEAGKAASPMERMQSVLRPLVALAIAMHGSEDSMILPSFSACPNCGTRVESNRSPFCSPYCREVAAFVRQFRASLATGLLNDPDRQLTLGQKLWALQGGGYPYRQTLVPLKTVAKVITRDGGKCSICGEPATEVDHAGSG